MIRIFKHLATERPGWLTLLFMGYFFLHSVGLHASLQTDGFSNLHPDSVVRMNPNISRMDHEPGEVLVKFQDAVKVNVTKSLGGLQTGIPGVDELLATHGVLEADQLIRRAQPMAEKQMLTAPTGIQFERPSLHNIYLLKTGKSDGSLYELIEALKEHPSVVYAEPNYIYRLVGHTVDSPVMTADDLNAYQDSQAKQAKSTIVPNDPLFDQQWWIGAIGADEAWVQSTGSTDQVIAILDTGVDWTHPDLQNKIWQNPGETANGNDSDGNGFVDDIRGWDFINQRNNPMDDNSHGTHVAGIAAAEADNGIGIVGVSWGAQIMPVKVLQSSGAGTAATIVQGINYAANNGATVINMSFGGYALSLAMQDALANAYATAVLVAAAGNDGICIGPGFFCAPMFPAAFSFVLGIEASNSSGSKAPFSNYDQDGPVYSAFPGLYNYELLAPGVQLISTIPGGSYRMYSGTSMAAPVIAGSATIYRSLYPDKSQEMMWADMIHSSNRVFNLPASLEGILDAKLSFVSHVLADTLDGDGDGRPDAGETIELFMTVRNTGAQANNAMVGIELSEFEDPSVVQIITDEASVGSISTYASRTNTNPLVFKIENDVADGRDIVFNLKVWHEDDQGIIYQPFIINVENGIELAGVLNEDLTLYPDNHYIITGNLAVAEDVTLTIKPGTKLKLAANKSLVVAGKLISIGTPDSLIWITKRDLSSNWSQINIGYNADINMDYSIIEYGGIHFPFQMLSTSSNGYISNSIFQNNYGTIEIGGLRFELNIIQNNHFVSNWATLNDNISVGLLRDATNFSNNNIINNKSMYSAGNAHAVRGIHNMVGNNSIGNCIFSNGSIGQNEKNIYAGHSGGNFSIISLSPNYHGSINEEKIKSGILDFDDSSIYNYVDVSNKLQKPPKENHGIVWKILVNDIEAQDEFEQLEPLGVGLQKFEVYFNRPMDIAYTPMVTFGVRAPYTQQAVNENGSWSADSTIFTVYKTMQLYTGDGINRVRVYGARDPEGFEIPIEDMRFEFLIDAAGAASAGFMATPGMGKIDLEWDDPGELDDLLGYNLYRFEHITDTTFTDPKLLNPALALEPMYTDFDVEPGDKYYYYYKILRTNLVESDSSRVVSAIPHTAAPGDANGDYDVNVLDIMAIVAYMLGNNPQPFIFEAADVNQDEQINVLDIVGVIQLINAAKGEAPGKNDQAYEPAFIALNNDVIVLDSKGQVAALQFELQTDWPDLIRLTSLLPGFELAWTKTDDGVRGILFNMQGKTIEAGQTSIVQIEHQNPDLTWGNLIGSDPEGKAVDIMTTPVGVDQHIALPMEFSLELFPNPAKDHLTVSYFLPVMSDVQVTFYDIFGKELTTAVSTRQTAGNYELSLNTQHLGVGSGMVFCRMTAVGADGSRYQRIQKLLIAR